MGAAEGGRVDSVGLLQRWALAENLTHRVSCELLSIFFPRASVQAGQTSLNVEGFVLDLVAVVRRGPRRLHGGRCFHRFSYRCCFCTEDSLQLCIEDSLQLCTEDSLQRLLFASMN